MKKLSVLFSVLLISSIMAFSQDKGKGKEEMLFDKTSHDFGDLAYGSDGTVVFKFRNNSKQPMALTNVKSSCGCTVPTWSREPIKPGESSDIIVKYNTNIPGTFNKTIQVFSSANNSPVRLSIMGSVAQAVKTGSPEGQKQAQMNEEEAKAGQLSNLNNQGTNTFPQTKAARLKQSGKMTENPVKKVEAEKKIK